MVPGLSLALKMAVTSLFAYQGLSFPIYKRGLSKQPFRTLALDPGSHKTDRF